MISKIEVTLTKADIEKILEEKAIKLVKDDIGYSWKPVTTRWDSDGSAIIQLEKKSIDSGYWER